MRRITPTPQDRLGGNPHLVAPVSCPDFGPVGDQDLDANHLPRDSQRHRGAKPATPPAQRRDDPPRRPTGHGRLRRGLARPRRRAGAGRDRADPCASRSRRRPARRRPLSGPRQRRDLGGHRRLSDRGAARAGTSGPRGHCRHWLPSLPGAAFAQLSGGRLSDRGRRGGRILRAGRGRVPGPSRGARRYCPVHRRWRVDHQTDPAPARRRAPRSCPDPRPARLVPAMPASGTPSSPTAAPRSSAPTNASSGRRSGRSAREYGVRARIAYDGLEIDLA